MVTMVKYVTIKLAPINLSRVITMSMAMMHGDTVILHVNDESEDSEIDSNLINGLPHAHTEPILPSTNFYEFEMQDIREVNDMPEPEVKEQCLILGDYGDNGEVCHH
jgi:hypothetical protein